jgi:hypothetical protein
MNKEIMKKAGFTEQVTRVENGLCLICEKQILVGSFRDALSEREFQISGLCQECQDFIFDGKEG